MQRLSLSLFALTTLAVAGCSTPLAMRSAEVLDPGEVELTAGAAMSVPSGIPAAAVNGRVGLFEGADLQLRVQAVETHYPVDAQAQLGFRLGDGPRLKTTAVAGVGYFGLFDAGIVDVPVGVMADYVFNDQLRLTLGTYISPNVAVGEISGGPAVPELDLRAAAQAGLTARMGRFVLRPEVGLEVSAVSWLVGSPYVNGQIGLTGGFVF
jgi:hypothetical protein